MLIKEISKNIQKWRDIPYAGTGRLNIGIHFPKLLVEHIPI
jgi:hypothetical protein